MSENPTKTTAVKIVYDLLRNDIINSALLPGHKLQIEQMAERYRIGVNPVREALNRLCSEGFVEHRDQRGFHVRPISMREFRELVRTRCWLDCKALEESILNRNAQWEEALVLIHHRLGRTPRELEDGSQNPQWEALHCDFHRALIANAGSTWLLQFCDELMNQAERYRFLADADSEHQRNTPDEHRLILDAALAGDVAAATSVLAEHFLRTLYLLEARFDKADQIEVNGVILIPE